MGKINASDKTLFKKTEKIEKKKNMEIKEFLHKALSKRLFWNGIHSFLERADARGSADIINRT